MQTASPCSQSCICSAHRHLPQGICRRIPLRPVPPDVGPDKGGILSYLETSAVGPVSPLIFKPGSRLNIITGDNSLGKSFLLDLIWWALTGSSVEGEIIPYRPSTKGSAPTITYQLAASIRTQPQKCTFSFETYSWSRPSKQQVLPGLV